MTEDRDDAWIQTFTGKRFWPLDPRPEDVDMTDIAHALSMKCRYGGHCTRFYSVAEHSVHVYRQVGTLEALLHDAAEAYSPFGDVPRPIKKAVTWVRKIEHAIELAIADRFGLVYPWPEEVEEADKRIIADEKAQVMWRCETPWPTGEGFYEPKLLGVELQCWPPAVAEQVFLWALKEAAG